MLSSDAAIVSYVRIIQSGGDVASCQETRVWQRGADRKWKNNRESDARDGLTEAADACACVPSAVTVPVARLGRLPGPEKFEPRDT
eukprot:1719676-Prymnesium_polylepis.1